MNKKYRTEQDKLGEVKIPKNVLWGIHTQRASDNFAISGRHVNSNLIHAFGAVKLAAARVNHELGYLPDEKFGAIDRACREVKNGLLDEHFITDPLQGGAGTSTNMNVNEVIANRALQIIGEEPGNYDLIDPLEDVNLHQSTNDTYPSALKVASIDLIRKLERKIVALTESFQKKEKEFADIVKVGRTQLQDAVLTTLGREMGAYADALARDRWRVYKCEERLRVLNLGGTAIGTGISAPTKYIFQVAKELKDITGFGLARSENLVDGTQNNDVFVEVSGIIKALAATLKKIANDLRLMSSGPKAGFNEIYLPQQQTGSSIMPGKINPVIPESVIQAAMKVFANDRIIADAVSSGNLELNAFLPVIADSMLESLEILINITENFRKFCVEGIQPREDELKRGIDNSTATITALVEKIGYKKAEEIAKQAEKSDKSIREIIISENILDEEGFDYLVSAEHVNKLGSKK